MKKKIFASLLCSVIMLNSYSVLADEVAVTTSEPAVTTEAVVPTSEPTVTTEVVAQKSDVAVDKKADTSVEQKDSKSGDVTTTSESTTTNDTTTSSTETVAENPKEGSKATTGVNNSYVSPTPYVNNQNIKSVEAETTTSQTTTEVAKQSDVILKTTEEPIVGTLTPLGVVDETKPVGTLEYLHRLPDTNGKAMKLSVLSGTFVISGLIIGLLYKFSRKIFG